MKKNILRICFVLLVILILTYIFIIKREETEEEFILPETAPVDTFSSVRITTGQIDPIYDSKNIQKERNKNKFDKQLREKLIELLNMPLTPPPISKIFRRTFYEKDKGTYIEKKISLITSNFSVAYAYLLIPKNIEFPAPAVIAMHQHGGTKYGSEEIIGNIGDPTLAYGKELAERGYIVFAMDAPTFGERNDQNDDSFEVREKGEAQDLFKRGYSPLGIIVQEDLISLDYLTSLDIVDKENIGCIGHSFGGIRCMYLSALDKRIKVTVLSSSVGSVRQDPTLGATHSWLTILPGLAKYTETSGILALISPRPLMIVYTDDPIYFIEDTDQVIKEVNRIYEVIKAREKFYPIFIPGIHHEFPKEIHDEAYGFLDKYLKT